MRKSIEIQRDLQAKIKAQRAIVEGAKDDKGVKRALNEDETEKFRTLQSEIEQLRSDLEDAKAYEENLRQAAAAEATPVETQLGNGEEREKEEIQERFDVKRMLENLVERSPMDGAEREVNDIGLEELRNSGITNVSRKGFNIPARMAFKGAKGVNRADAQTVTEDSGNFGGSTVQEDAGRVLPAFVDRLSIEELGIVPMYDLVGDYPLHSVADFAFENVTETQGLTAQKAQMSKRVLKPKRTGMMVYISNQLLAQSSINIMGVLGRRTNEALSRRLMSDLINGDGVAPNTLGLLNDALAFDFPGTAGALTLAKVLQIEGEVDEENATEDGLMWLVHKKAAAIAKSIPIDSGSGLFLMDKQNQLYGMPTKKTTLMPVLNSDTEYPYIYGDFKSVEAGFWGGINIKADENTRADSNEVRLIVNVHRDIMASNPKAFAVNKKITIA
ncbi:phage major capsid protein [Flagellimonas sp. S174]|uniref:phage major capsid protein n=1 Tax=Flagellimonas sp. S174 TaxID=3410790 RepID=UPI003BF49648